MPLMQFCSNCRAENLSGATVCERCGTPLSETEPNSYDQKLIQALHHPIPEMRDMAAILLGQHRNRHALPVLLSRLREETDTGVLCAIIQALAQLEDCEAVSSLAKRLAQPHALAVALTIVDALAALAQTGCWEAREVLKAPPPVSEKVAQEIAVSLETLNRLYY
jgi:HEAT repeat protein